MERRKVLEELIKNRNQLMEDIHRPHNKGIKRLLIGEIIAYQKVIDILKKQ